jgi:hypothetical protein
MGHQTGRRELGQVSEGDLAGAGFHPLSEIEVEAAMRRYGVSSLDEIPEGSMVIEGREAIEAYLELQVEELDVGSSRSDQRRS